ncbi:MAG: hypothetical protein KDC16_06080 [Saprospiraceae bacterium]|nr:hypothetical protein [Saprospiraceae bacterium]
MKIRLLLASMLILLHRLILKAQKSSEVYAYIEVSHSELLTQSGLDGGASYELENPFEFGLRFRVRLSAKLKLETGITLYNAKVIISAGPSPFNLPDRKESIELLSFPALINYDIGKNYYLCGGILLDFQTRKRSFDSQSGIAYEIGIGKKIFFDNIIVTISPNFKRHNVIQFESNYYPEKLTELGILVGLGYAF